ncbi:MAG: hypothetical protein IJS52_05780 [Bacilli bacterium]|nr:hypothetical protein [Bacilli bacterium]
MIIALSTLFFLLAFVCVLTVTALGGMFSEKSGTIALSLEGCMTIGALCAGIAMHLLPASIPDSLCALLILIIAIVSAGAYSLLLAIASITFKADQTLVGTALNILSTSIAVVLVKLITKTDALPVGQSRLNFTRFYEIFNVEFFGMQGVRFNWITLIVLALIPIVSFIKTFPT